MCVCEMIETEVNQLTQEQLDEHHFDLLIELAESAREIANLQMKIQFLTNRIEEVEVKLEDNSTELKIVN
jgi:hypothetical protein